MALGAIARALQAGLARLGEPCTLAGVDIGRVMLERGADVFVGDPGRADDNYTAQADVVVIPSAANPAVGQALVHPEGSFKLSRLLEDNGYNKTFVVVAQ